MKHAWSIVLLLPLLGCGGSYSPNTYNTAAVQQAAKVDRGVVLGIRAVGVSANGAAGAVTGAAAGGIAGSQVGSGGVTGAFGALGGTVIGGLVGASIEHSTADSPALEYIVRKTNGDLVSVTQQDPQPLAIGQKVLVIAGAQARIVPDYTVEPEPPPPTKTEDLSKAARSKPPTPNAPDATVQGGLDP
jgi:outer membrane lipoprotein SlyB